jgi:hypothetical protein
VPGVSDDHPYGLVVILASNLMTMLVTLVRIRAAARTQRNHELTRYEIVRAIGQGSRIVDIDGVGMVIDIGGDLAVEGRSHVDH